MAPHRSAAVAFVAAMASVALVACVPQGNPVATFRVIDEEYRIELATPELVAHAEALLAGEPVASIPLGRVVRGETSVNTGCRGTSTRRRSSSRR